MANLENDDRRTGTAGFVIFEDTVGRSGQIEIPIVYWASRATKSFQDTSNSANFDPNKKILFPTQVQTAMRVEGMLRGRYRISRLPGTLVTAMFSGEMVPTISLYIDPSFQYGYGYFNISEFEVSSPIDGTVDFECRIMSLGTFNITLQSWTPEANF